MQPPATISALDGDRCYRAVSSRDRRFDGTFVTAVRSTGIYCRPSCPARTPKRANVTFFKTAAGAHEAGYRACRRCAPDAAAGSPEWDLRADLVGRAMRLIRDGVVEREGVPGLSRRLGYSERQVLRALRAELGAGPLAIARSERAHAARTLIETTAMPFTDVAFASGFCSIRQFNDTIRAVYARTPTELRSARGNRAAGTYRGAITLRLGVREPFDRRRLLAFLAARAIPGVETVSDSGYSRTVTGSHGDHVLSIDLSGGEVRLRVPANALGDLQQHVAATRRLLDLDADPAAVAGTLSAAHPAMAAIVARGPGLRVPGQTSGFELAVRAIIGQQISVAGARTVALRLTERHGATLPEPAGELQLVFPRAEALAAADPGALGMPRRRGLALVTMANAVAGGELDLSVGADRDESRSRLLAIPGVGPWTASYIAMRALRDPDAWPEGDLVAERALGVHGMTTSDLEAMRPWRAYAAMQLWNSTTEGP